LTAALLLSAAPALAQRTDVVTMANGDRVTCEINTLDRGILEVATDSWGTISIVNLSVLDSYDSRPPSDDAQGHDFTLVTSLGWSF
jgi:hypothetical protein